MHAGTALSAWCREGGGAGLLKYDAEETKTQTPLQTSNSCLLELSYTYKNSALNVSIIGSMSWPSSQEGFFALALIRMSGRPSLCELTRPLTDSSSA